MLVCCPIHGQELLPGRAAAWELWTPTTCWILYVSFTATHLIHLSMFEYNLRSVGRSDFLLKSLGTSWTPVIRHQRSLENLRFQLLQDEDPHPPRWGPGMRKSCILCSMLNCVRGVSRNIKNTHSGKPFTIYVFQHFATSSYPFLSSQILG